MPIGQLVQVGLVTLGVLLALRPPMPKHTAPWNTTFAVTFLINEQPLLVLLLWLVPPTLSVLSVAAPFGVVWLLTAALATVATVALALLAARTTTARPALVAALREGLGAPELPVRHTPMPWVRIVLAPFLSYRRDVRRVRNQSYGPGGRGHRLDLYVPRAAHDGAPVFLYLHGGTFRIGNKLLGARPLLYRLASRGWVCASANYRLRWRGVGYADQLADTKSAIAWLRQHAAEHGADPEILVVAGGSAGAHLAATAALTAEDPVSAVVGLYGYYGPADAPGRAPVTPHDVLSPDAPPFFVIHGALDTLVLADDARRFTEELRQVSERPVVYAELPGTQHNFDLFHSLRFHAVVDAVEEFVEWVAGRSGQAAGRSTPGASNGAASSQTSAPIGAGRSD